MKKIILTGRLGKLFGRVHNLDVSSPAEAIRALCYLLPNFEFEFKRLHVRIAFVDRDGRELDLNVETIHVRFGRAQAFKIEPVPEGAKLDWLKVALGAVLVAGAFLMSGGTLGAVAFGALGMNVTYGQIALVGGLLAVSGVAGMLTPQIAGPAKQEQTKSWLMDAIGNKSAQGGPVPLVYGKRVFVGSVVVSNGIFVEDYEGNGKDDVTKALGTLSTLKLIDLVSHGPIGGLKNGDRSVFFNKIPYGKPNGDKNFRGISYQIRTGTDNQSAFAGIPSVTNEMNLGLKLTKALPLSFTVSDPDAAAVLVKVRIPSLLKYERKEPNVKDQKVTVAFSLDPAGGNSEGAGQITFSGHATAPIERVKRIELPKGKHPWKINVKRMTNDKSDQDNPSNQNDTYLSSYTIVYDAKVTYRNSAVIKIEADARRFGSQAPERLYEIEGIMCKIPSNWNPVTRVYTGVWDGTFKIDVHDNPVWVFYDLLTNPIYGLGTRIPAEQIDKFGLYAIAQYCDELVPDGNGGLEPRFTFNDRFDRRMEAGRLLDTLASVFRGMIYFGAGLIYVTQDRPGTPRKIVGPANVKDARINYSGSGLTARHDVVMVQWRDNDNFGTADFEMVQRDDIISQFGLRDTSVVAVGATTRGQARRVGEWVLETEENETEVAVYRTGLDQADLRPGELIDIADPFIMGTRMSGRVVEIFKNHDIGAKDLTNAAWVKVATTITANATQDHQGNILADKIVETATTNNHYVYQVHTGVAIGQRVTRYIIAKAAERTRILLQTSDFTSWVVSGQFDLSTGTIVSPPSPSAGWSNVWATIEPMGNGYYKCAVSGVKANADPDAYSATFIVGPAGTANYLGDGVSGLYIAHSQWEFSETAGPAVVNTAVLVDGPVQMVGTESYDFAIMLENGARELRDIILWEDDAYNRNLAFWPFDVSTSGWDRNGVIQTVNVDTAPDGTMTADKSVATAVSTSHYLGGFPQLVAPNQNITASIYIKQSGIYSRFQFQLYDWTTGNNIYMRGDLATGQIELSGANGLGTFVSARMEAPDAEGYTRLVLSGKPTSVDDLRLYSARVWIMNATNVFTFTGDGVSGFLTWGLKIETGLEATPVFQGYKLLHLASHLSDDIVPYAMWSVYATNVQPRTFKVLTNLEKGDNEFEITALFHDPNKFARVERDRQVSSPFYSIYDARQGELRPPHSIVINELVKSDGNGRYQPWINIAWPPSSDQRVTGYEFQSWDTENGGYGEIIIPTEQGVDFGPIESPMVFSARVRSTSEILGVSEWAYIDEYVLGPDAPPDDVTGLTVAVTGNNVVLDWDTAADAFTQSYEVRFTPETVSPTWEAALPVARKISRDTSIATVQAQVGTYMVKGVSERGVYSRDPVSVFANRTADTHRNIIVDLDESAAWEGLFSSKAIPVGIYDSQMASTFWTKTNATIVASTGFRETAVNGIHSTKPAYEFDAPGSCEVTITFTVNGLGRQLKTIITTDRGDEAFMIHDPTTDAFVSSSRTGDIIITQQTVTATGITFKVITHRDTEKITMEVRTYNGATDTFLGDITKGFDFTSIQCTIKAISVVEDGSGFLRLADLGNLMFEWEYLGEIVTLSGDYPNIAYYTFSNDVNWSPWDASVDLGAQFVARFVTEFNFEVPADAGIVADWSTIGMMEALSGTQKGVTITPQVRFTSGTPVPASGGLTYLDWGEWEDLKDSAYLFRAAQYRFKIENIVPQVTPVIKTAKLTCFMDDRILHDFDVSTTGPALPIVFPGGAFYDIPSIQITPYNLGGGSFEITNRTTSGFTIRFFNAAGTAVGRTFDWIAKGYGEVK